MLELRLIRYNSSSKLTNIDLSLADQLIDGLNKRDIVLYNLTVRSLKLNFILIFKLYCQSTT